MTKKKIDTLLHCISTMWKKPLFNKTAKGSKLFSWDFVMGKVFITIFCIVALFPFALITGVYFYQKQKLEEINQTLSLLEKRASGFSKAYYAEKAFEKIYANVDRDFLTKEAEKFFFLEKDVQKLTRMIQAQEEKDTAFLRSYLDSITKDYNRLSFIPKEVKKNDVYQELLWKQEKPILLELEEALKTLELVEKPEKNKPYLSVKKFSLKRNAPSLNHTRFAMDMEVFQREVSDRRQK